MICRFLYLYIYSKDLDLYLLYNLIIERFFFSLDWTSSLSKEYNFDLL